MVFIKINIFVASESQRFRRWKLQSSLHRHRTRAAPARKPLSLPKISRIIFLNKIRELEISIFLPRTLRDQSLSDMTVAPRWHRIPGVRTLV